ncbi:beta-glucuronidase-like [Dysidea avara]|uniref:beta-glucuronidase-like n=1 Tax=Dysidea avara TaxID=196820 RepID=UPI00331FCF45
MLHLEEFPVKLVLFVVVISSGLITNSAAGLYPQESESRIIVDLAGIWNFRVSTDPDQGFTEKWYMQPLSEAGPVIDMPVPSSYNDITQDRSIRDHIGWVWYDRIFYQQPRGAADQRLYLRFEGVHYYCIVWLNGQEILVHEGAHLPFEADVTSILFSQQPPYRITVAVNNTLTPTTLPCGTVEYLSGPMYPPGGFFIQNLQFDFFNYAGIQHRVLLHSVSAARVQDMLLVTMPTSEGSSEWILNCSLNVTGGPRGFDVQLLDKNGTMIARYGGDDSDFVLRVHSPKLWWPWTMSKYGEVAYLYTLHVQYGEDIYRQPVGFRTVEVKGTEFLINGKPFYFHGVNKHEDADIRGKGYDVPLILKDVNMMKWLGVNAFRTSHYPYSQELMHLCDKEGIVVIDETPAVGLHEAFNFVNQTLQHHLQVTTELILRDRNHPSVVMWSLANEPNSGLKESESYFETVFKHAHKLDPTRPLTFTCSHDYDTDLVTKFADVICINRYYGWYKNMGYTNLIPYEFSYDLEQWHNIEKKPMIISEYGAGTIAGFHENPSTAFTEEYQVEVLEQHFSVFDKYSKQFLVGELIWNFADFMTEQKDDRPVGNKKGVLTRQRHPKSAAFVLRDRYMGLAGVGNHSLKN